MNFLFRFLLVVILLAIAGLLIVGPVRADQKKWIPARTVKDRVEAIRKCQDDGGIPVVIAGPISSEGIGCASSLW